MRDATPGKCEYGSLLEAFAFCEMKKINLAVYQIKDRSAYHIMTWKHTNDNAPTVWILFLHELQHYQALLCQSPLDIQTFNDSTTSVSKYNLSLISNTKLQNNLQLSDITLESHQSSDQISSRIDYTSIQQNTSAAHWSFLNDCEINKIMAHLSGMKLNDLKALYDTVSLKLTKQNGYIVDYNPILTAVLGCHSNALC